MNSGKNEPTFGQELNYWRAHEVAQLRDGKTEKKIRSVQCCPSPRAKLEALLCISLQPPSFMEMKLHLQMNNTIVLLDLGFGMVGTQTHISTNSPPLSSCSRNVNLTEKKKSGVCYFKRGRKLSNVSGDPSWAAPQHGRSLLWLQNPRADGSCGIKARLIWEAWQDCSLYRELTFAKKGGKNVCLSSSSVHILTAEEGDTPNLCQP